MESTHLKNLTDSKQILDEFEVFFYPCWKAFVGMNRVGVCPCKSRPHLRSFALVVKANLDLKIQNFRISNRTGTKSENGICHAVFLI